MLSATAKGRPKGICLEGLLLDIKRLSAWDKRQS